MLIKKRWMNSRGERMKRELKKIDLPPPKPFSLSTMVGYFVILVLIALSYWSGIAVEFSLSRLIEGLPYMADFLSRMWPPDLTVLDRVWKETLLTVQLAWVATVISLFLSLPVGFLAASNVFESKALRSAVIFFLNADRAIDALIVALFFVSAVGLGPFPGTLALAIHSVGMLGKLFADAIEAIDRGPVEALESAGAGKLATIRWAIWPQVAPHFISFFLFRFELNIRVAVVLGLVGAGGIGFLLTQYMRLFQYQKLATVVLVILVLVMVVDFFSARLRKAVL
ncbi:MAG: phosphonate ABC transporter, permease protein PhnE [Oligoflexia bacterium]|nr:phosphonate ABC transporter, permease protein PhnE [Oligoflexia bacterium]